MGPFLRRGVEVCIFSFGEKTPSVDACYARICYALCPTVLKTLFPTYLRKKLFQTLLKTLSSTILKNAISKMIESAAVPHVVASHVLVVDVQH